jgi:L-aminopeptidase/D-esterase-like protein
MAIGSLAAIVEGEVNSSLTAVPGIRAGHWTHPSGSTGCTVIVADGGAVAGVDVRGGAPGTRETDLLRPEMSVDSVHAVVLSGGSAYGLAAADGVMQYLESEGVGFPVGGSVVPIVPAAILFDLAIGDPTVRPTAKSGLAAARDASRQPVPMGSVGAGAGATVGKLFGPRRAMRGGLGSAAIPRPDGLVVGAIAAVNALGDVVDPATGEILAGARTADGSAFADSMAQLRSARHVQPSGTVQNTTIAVVAANVTWTKTQAAKTAQMAHDGLAMAIRPAHMPFDGDTVFALGTGGRTVDARMFGEIGALAADVLAQAVVAAVRAAESGFGLPAARDL